MKTAKKLEILHCEIDSGNRASFFEESVKAGFPSPAEGSEEKRLNLNDLLVKRPAATFFIRVEGDSMIDANIHSNDILVVDRSIQPTMNKVVIARIGSDFTVKRLKIRRGKHFLSPENPNYPEIPIEDGDDIEIWGVVTYVIHKT